MTHAFIYFLAGAIISQLISRLVGLLHGASLFIKIENFTSLYVVFLERTMENYTNSQLRILSESGLSAEELEKSLTAFNTLKTLFRKNVLVIMLTAYPKRYLGQAKYKTWQELETYVEAKTSKGRNSQ